MSDVDQSAIISRLAVVESQIGDVRGDLVRMEKHISTLYAKAEHATWWLVGLLAAALLNLAVLMFKT